MSKYVHSKLVCRTVTVLTGIKHMERAEMFSKLGISDDIRIKKHFTNAQIIEVTKQRKQVFQRVKD